jgi:hypothetical protein
VTRLEDKISGTAQPIWWIPPRLIGSVVNVVQFAFQDRQLGEIQDNVRGTLSSAGETG